MIMSGSPPPGSALLYAITWSLSTGWNRRVRSCCRAGRSRRITFTRAINSRIPVAEAVFRKRSSVFLRVSVFLRARFPRLVVHVFERRSVDP